MRYFEYKGGELYAEDVPLREIAEKVGTPTYVYSTQTLIRHFNVLKNALAGLNAKIAFAVKSNSNKGVIATLAAQGAGADTVSEGEIRRAINAGVEPSKIVFSGVGKTASELEYAVSVGIHQINIESAQELDILDEVTQKLGKAQAVVFRVNPDVAAGGHAKISTGKSTSKFGIDRKTATELYEKAQSMKYVKPVGLAVHIGSQIFDLEPLKASYEFLAGFAKDLRAAGFEVSRLDLGGGLAAIYDDNGEGPDVAAYGQIIKDVIGPLNVEVEIEPGRLITANSGVLLSEVLIQKNNGGKDFVVLDAAMNDLIRPALYEAYHQLLPVKQSNNNESEKTIVGPICETGDTFAKDRLMGDVANGDYVAFMSSGAYGFSMASTYNSRPLIAEVMVNGDKWEIVRPRQTYEELFGMETTPSWVK